MPDEAERAFVSPLSVHSRILLRAVRTVRATKHWSYLYPRHELDSLRQLPRNDHPKPTLLMRSFYTSSLVLFTFFVAQAATAQWVNQAPKPTKLDVRGIAAPTPDRVFLATEDDSFDNGGALWDSEDGGATWTQRDVPFNLNDPLNGIFFLDNQNGWTFGNDNYRTTDGGDTWEEMTFLGSTYFMEFYNDSFGFAVTNGDNWVSRDGGLTWEIVSNDMFAFDFADDQIGLGVSDAGIYRTTDGGNTFGLVLAGDADAVTFLASTVAVSVVDGNFVRSTDGGLTWAAGEAAEGRTRFEVLSADVVLAWARTGVFGDDPKVFRSTDGGQTWTDLGDVLGSGAHDLAASDATTVVAIDSDESMFFSADEGLTWTETYSSPGPSASFFNSSAIVFADALTGYAGYGPGFVIKTTDGGATWSQISSGVGETLWDVDHFADGRLIAVGDDGTVLTNTGTDGAPWVLHEALTTEVLRAVHVVGPNEVVVLDDEGFVYRSADGGDTWTKSLDDPPLDDAADLFFNTPLEGWILGGFSSNALYHTTNGGDTWTASGTFAGIYTGLDFVGDSGWAVNASNVLQYTTDGGATWTESFIPVTSPNDIDFFNESVGYVAGWFGEIARSDDGGVTWELLTIPEKFEDDKFWDLYLLSENEFWISTTNDRAYYTANGGISWTVLEIGSEGSGSFFGIAASPDGDAWTIGDEGYIEHFMGPPGAPPNLPPVASFDVAVFGLDADFTDRSTDVDGTIVSHFWEFGDGATSTEQNPSHTYAEEGFYSATLTVTDDDGDTGDLTRQVFVTPLDQTLGDFTEVTPAEYPFITQPEDDFWVATTASADYDADGDLDIAVLGYYVVYNESVDYQLLLMTNEGNASAGQWNFQYIEAPLGDDVSTGDSDLAWGDADGDGDQDLALGSDGQTLLYRNDDGALVLTESALPGYNEDYDLGYFDQNALSWADYDNDGDKDLLIPSVYDPGTFEYRTALMRNDGDDGSGGWIFTETDSTFAATKNAHSAWADYDGDNDLDLLLVEVQVEQEEGFNRLYVNEGNGSFVGQDLFAGLAIQAGNAQWQDYDGDGDYDFLVAGSVYEPDGTFRPILRIYRGEGGGYTPVSLIEGSIFEDDGGIFSIKVATWADYDSDGDVDILMAGSLFPNNGNPTIGRAKIFLNDGAGSFTFEDGFLPSPHSASSFFEGTFAWLDLDNDLDLDYFIAGEYFEPSSNSAIESQMHLYRNDTNGQNAAPTMPTNLNASVDEENSSATLSWNPASDDSTPPAALTYDLDLYLSDVPVDPPHRLPEWGSISAVTQWAFGGLADGVYNWTIRAVDNAFVGGPVAQGSFSVGVTTANSPDAVPHVYSFDGTYPNPFRGSTTIRYGLPETADVEIAVYDLLGRMVTRIKDSERPAGLYNVILDASALASGVYFVRFSTESFTATRRVVVVR